MLGCSPLIGLADLIGSVSVESHRKPVNFLEPAFKAATFYHIIAWKIWGQTTWNLHDVHKSGYI